MRQGSKTLTEHELEIMKVVWQHHEATVRQVYEALLQHKQVAYTTVSTMMNILEGKGYLEKRPDGRAYCYRPTEPQQKVVSTLVGDFLDRVFDGSARPLLLSLIEDRKVSARDLDEIAHLIEGEEE